MGNETVDSDSKSRKIRLKMETVMIFDSIYAACFIIWRKKIFFSVVVVIVVGWVSDEEILY
jgi:hypothetical protein